MTSDRREIYESVTQSIVEALEAGASAGDFRAPWHGAAALPLNGLTGKAYRGINVPALWATQAKKGYSSPLWATFKQWQEKGAQVRKGEKSARVVFWKTFEHADADDAKKSRTSFYANYSPVFNAEQVEGLGVQDQAELKNMVETIDHVETFVKNTKAAIQYAGNAAFYHTGYDTITMPPRNVFTDTQDSTATEGFYATLLHELTHWSGAESRLDRAKGVRNSKEFAIEEIIAELGSAMLCASLGITNRPRPDHAKYLDGWLGAMKQDSRFIFTAASHAQKAADFLHAFQNQEAA